MNSFATPNALLSLVWPSYRTRLIDQVGGEVARECQADLWQCIRRRILGMSIPEIRGYARAHAVVFVAAQVDEVLERRSLRPALRARVAASAVDQLVSMTVRDALCDESPAEPRLLAA